jgi:shikimate dehydrogenase
LVDTMVLLNLNSGKRVCGVIGNPLGQSVSPMMHNAAFEELGLNYIYQKFEISERELKNTILMLKAKNFVGLNITHPFKILIIDHLDKIDDLAKEIGAVNTILNRNGELIGYNTDSYGALAALQASGLILENMKHKILIIGAGGAARAAAVPLAKLGNTIIIANRTLKHAEEIVKILQKANSPEAVLLTDVYKVIEDVGVMINCTPVGMTGGPGGCVIPLEFLRKELVVFDMVYSPINTELISAARKSGSKVVYGYEMLISQGIKSFELWTGKSAPAQLMRKIVIDELNLREKILQAGGS